MCYNFSATEQKQLLNEHINNIENNPKLDLKVSSRLIKPHWIVKNFKNNKKFKKPDVIGYNEYFEDGNMILQVYENNKNRSLRIMNCLLKNLEILGYNFKFKRPGLYLEKDRIIVGIIIQEKHKRIIDNSGPYSTSELVPTGFLKLKLYRSLHTKEYIEKKTISFQENIPKLLGYIETFKDSEKDYQKHLEEGWERQRKKREEELKIKERIEFEMEIFRHYIALEKIFSKLDKLKEMKERLELRLDEDFTYKNLSKNEYLDKIAKRLEWLDPLSKIEDDLLSENHKKEFLAFLE